VVWTAHDLRNPHTADADRDDPYLEVLADRADAVLTLTASAAAELRDRFGRTATVIPHGPLLPADTARWLRTWATGRAAAGPLAGEDPTRGDPAGGDPTPGGDPTDADPPGTEQLPPRADDVVTVLLHAKSLRRNLDVLGCVAAMAALPDDVPVRLLLSLHDEPEVRRTIPDRLPPNVTAWWHPPLEHATLAAAIAGADALLLPYRWGTHSGLLELALDVGTPVLASDAGAFADQGPVRTFPVIAEGVEVAGLAAALRDAADGRLPPAPSWADREAAAQRFLEEHRRTYREVLAG
jgi:beta-1,4-mannosyltransferase